MNTIVILLLNEKYRQELLDFFQLPRYELFIKTTELEILEVCRTELVDLILVWDASETVLSNLLTLLKKASGAQVPVVSVVKTPQQFHMSIEAGAYDVFQIPMPKKEFKKLIDQILNLPGEIPTEGTVELNDNLTEASNLINSLHRLSKNRESALITVTESGHSGRIYLKNGKIVRANFRTLEGMDALNKMVGLYRAEMTVHMTEVSDEGQIDMEVSEVLVQLHQRLNEQQKFFGPALIDSEKLVIGESDTKRSDVQSDLEKHVLELMRQGQSAYDLITVSNRDNLELLRTVKNLLDRNIIVSKKKQEVIPEEETSTKPERKRFSFFRKLFGRRHNRRVAADKPESDETYIPTEEVPVESSEPRGQRELDAEVRHKLLNYFTDRKNADS